MTSIALKGFRIDKQGKLARDVRRLSASARQQRQASSRVRVNRGRGGDVIRGAGTRCRATPATREGACPGLFYTP